MPPFAPAGFSFSRRGLSLFMAEYRRTRYAKGAYEKEMEQASLKKEWKEELIG